MLKDGISYLGDELDTKRFAVILCKYIRQKMRTSNTLHIRDGRHSSRPMSDRILRLPGNRRPTIPGSMAMG
jgi:hypothetical protein